jgi:8-oxo-dGTP pyrophosphatase MutT (NUDIX family)
MPERRLTVDPRFGPLREIFWEGIRDPFPAPEGQGEEERIHAAVSIILRAGPDLEILLIRRADAEGDPWSGHMALPGGRREDGDEDLRATAIRETLEETGVCLESRGVKLGCLDPVSPATRRLPPISIFPFLFGVGEGTGAQVASSEVAEVLWVPLSSLRGPQAEGTVQIPLGDERRTFPCIRVGRRVVWGLTYRILTNFLDRLDWKGPELSR